VSEKLYENNVEELLRIRYKCEDLLKKYKTHLLEQDSKTNKKNLKIVETRLNKVNKELKKRAM
jgi:hypothetical protein